MVRLVYSTLSLTTESKSQGLHPRSAEESQKGNEAASSKEARVTPSSGSEESVQKKGMKKAQSARPHSVFCLYVSTSFYSIVICTLDDVGLRVKDGEGETHVTC